MIPFIGRSTELDALEGCLRDARGGRGSVALIEGVAGIGKSRLVGEALHRARRLGAVVIHGRAEELETSRPFGPFAGASTHRDGDGHRPAGDPVEAVVLASVLPVPSAASQANVIAALLADIEDLAMRSPVVVALEDLQWADPATLLTILALLERLDDLPIAMILSLRPLPRTSRLDRLLEALLARPVRALRLGPLEPDEVERLVAAHTVSAPGPSLVEQVQRAAGNPFYVQELLRALDAEGAIAVVDGHSEVAASSLPETLGSTILRHLRYLDAEVLDLLELAAVLGTSFRGVDLAALCRQHFDELIAPLRQAVDAGVLHDRPGGFAFRHDLVREALYLRLPAGLRGQLHLAAGRALDEVGAPMPQVATHLAIGAQPGDQEAIDRLRRAALETAMSAPDIAEGFLRRALDLTLPTDPGRDQLRVDLVTLLVASGQPTAARTLGGEVVAGAPDPAVLGRLRFALGQADFLHGDFARAIEQMTLAATDTSLTEAERALALAEAAMVRLFSAGDLAGAEADGLQAGQMARAAGDLVGESMALCVLAGVAQFRGHIDVALAHVERATALGAEPVEIVPGGLNSALRDPYMFQGMALLDADRLDEAREAFRAGARISADRGVAGRGHFYHYWSGYRDYLAGAWDDAVAELQTGLALADEIENLRGTLAAHAMLALIAFHRGQRSMAEEHLSASEQRFASDGPDFGVVWMLLGRALLTESDGDAEAARDLLGGSWRVLEGLGSRFHYRPFGADLVRIALQAGDVHLADEVATSLEALAIGQPVATVRGTALHCRGLAGRDPAVLRSAVETLREGPRPLALASALEDAATAAARDGNTEQEVRRMFAEARDIYATLRAAHDDDRCVARMRAVGIPPGARGPRRRPDHGWESLTPTELRVAELVTEGLTNPQIGARLFVSRRTIQTHVSNVLRKLELVSRVELAAEMTRRR